MFFVFYNSVSTVNDNKRVVDMPLAHMKRFGFKEGV